MRRTKALIAAAFVGLLSLSAAWSASAAFDFEAEGYPAAISGENVGPHLFTIENGITVECEEAAFSGEIAEPEEAPEVLPEYGGCMVPGFVVATITANGCTFRLHANEEVAAEEFDGLADLVCPGGKKLAITAGTCEVQIGGQTGLGEVSFQNQIESSPTDLMVDIGLTGVKYSKTKDGIFCPLSGTGEKADGAYDGDVLSEATNEAAATAFAVALKGTELCKVSEINPCKSPYSEGTVLAAELVAATNATFKYEFEGAQKTITCSKSSLTASIGKHVGIELSGEMNPLTFPVCEKDCSGGALNAPFETRTIPVGKVGDGQMSLFKAVTGPIFFVGCTGKHACAYSSSSLIGKITGGEDATWLVSDTLGTKLGTSDKGCGSSLSITANYQFYKPKVGEQPQMWVSAG